MKLTAGCFLLSVMWCGGAQLRCVLDGELQDDCAHPDLGQVQLSQHAAGQWHHHHLCVLPGFPRCSEGEPLSPPDGNSHILFVLLF